MVLEQIVVCLVRETYRKLHMTELKQQQPSVTLLDKKRQCWLFWSLSVVSYNTLVHYLALQNGRSHVVHVVELKQLTNCLALTTVCGRNGLHRTV